MQSVEEKQQQNLIPKEEDCANDLWFQDNKCIHGPKALSSVSRHLPENLRCLHIKDYPTKIYTFKICISLNTIQIFI